MKQRFAVTLLAVAIASLSATAFAIAPVISDFRSPVIGDDAPVSNSNDFYYQDVFDLNTKASDPDLTVTPGNIIWSYTGDGTYRIDNVVPLNTLSESIITPPAAKRIGDAANQDSKSADGNPRTITLRNVVWSPDDATPRQDPPGPNGILDGQGGKPNHIRALTVFASDGSSATMKSFTVYTYDGGSDALSGIAMELVEGTTTPSGWTSSSIIDPVTFTSTSGLCIGTGLAGNFFASWTSPYKVFDLTQNKVYRFRINVETTATVAVGATPLWDFVIDNVAPTGSEQKYSYDQLVLDNHGGKNSVGQAEPTGKRNFDLWWAPLPVEDASWNNATTGEFATAHDPFNDGRFHFRVLDVNGTVDGNNDAGTICLRSYRIDQIDVDDLAVTSNAFLRDDISSTNTFGTSIFGATSFTYGGGNVTITPNVAGVENAGGPTVLPPATPGSWNLEVVLLDVGDTTIDFTPANANSLLDNWPVPWTSNQLLKTTVNLQAPNALGENNPPDAIRLVHDSVTSEIAADSIVSAGANLIGLPKQTATNYVMFFHTQNETASPTTQYHRIRPRLGLLFQEGIFSGGLTGTGKSSVNNGGVRVNSFRVDVLDINGL